MKKLITVFVIIIAFGINAFGQQLPLHSQYMMDLSMVNPAVCGSYDFSPISASYRQQWVGFEGAPVTQYLNAHTYAGKNVGLGLSLFNELASPSRRTGVQFSFAYHLPISKDYTKKISFGLSPVLFHHYINTSLLTPEELNDPAIISGVNNQLCPDLNFGAMFTSGDKYFVGFSVFNLLQIRRDLFEIMDEINNPIKRAYYLVAGYSYKPNDNFTIEPSTLVQYQANCPIQFDVNLRGMYKNMVGVGVSYRYLDALVYMAFFNINNFRIGYSYDMTMSDIKKYSQGSHEFHITYRISSRKNSDSNLPKFPIFY